MRVFFCWLRRIRNSDQPLGCRRSLGWLCLCVYDTGCKIFEGRRKAAEALHDVALCCPPASFTAVIRPLGCGKSIAPHVALGLDIADAGAFLTNGEAPIVTAKSSKTDIVFQNSAARPWRSKRRNNEVPLEVVGLSRNAHANPGQSVEVVEFWKRLLNTP